MAAATKQTTKTCYCNNCKREFTRRDLDGRWLCADCRTMPGVQGYRDPSKRGIEGGSPAYWKQTASQLNVITDDAPAAAPSGQRRRITVERFDEATGEFVAEDGGLEPPEQLGGTLKAWRADAFADGKLSSDQKLLLLRLAEHARWDSQPHPGGNVFPSVRTMAVELGWSAARVQRTIKAVRGAWITVVEVEAESRHAETIVQLSNHYVLRWPDGRRLSAFDKRLA